MRRSTAGGAIPERQPTAPDHSPVEFEPRLKLKHRVHQKPVGRLEIGGRLAPKTRRNEQDVRRAQHLAPEERLMKKRREARRQTDAKCEDLTAPIHELEPPCDRGVQAGIARSIGSMRSISTSPTISIRS